MAWGIEQWNACARAWAGMTVAILWQSTVFGVGLGLFALWLPKSAPALRCWLWRIVALKLLLMPFWVWSTPLPQWKTAHVPLAAQPERTAAPQSAAIHGDGSPSFPTSGTNTASAVVAPGKHWLSRVNGSSWLLLIWSAAVCWQAARIMRQAVRLSRLLRTAVCADPSTARLVGQLSAELGLKRPPAVQIIDACCPPFVCGIRRPRIVLSKRLVASLDRQRLRRVLLHELAHLRRSDLAWDWLSEVARMMYFFHPLAHWAYHQIRLERELACDQLAMTAGGDSVPDYAGTLASVVRDTSAAHRRPLGVMS